MAAGRPLKRWGLPTAAGRAWPADREQGLVIPAVLLTVMVMTLGVLALVSRVAATRKGAASTALAASARQAAEYGFAQVVAEMNRDGKSYLWVTLFGSWNSVSASDLQSCGIASASPPTTNPIPGVSSAVALPGNGNLSYRLTGYEAPGLLASNADPCQIFGNRKGGSGTLEITGTARRSSGDPRPASYTLRRSVTVGQAVPLLKPTIFSGSTNGPGTYSMLFPDPANLTGIPRVPPWPDVTCETTDVNGKYKCNIADASGTPEYFGGVPNKTFPYQSDSSQISRLCDETSKQLVCRIGSLTLGQDVDMAVDVKNKPVNLFISGDISIQKDADLCPVLGPGENCDALVFNKEHLGLRLFGRNDGSACIGQSLDFAGSSRASETVLNIRNVLMWFPSARVKTIPKSIGNLPVIVGLVCEPNPGARDFLKASPSDLVYGLSQTSLPLLFYRGYGAWQQTFQPDT